MDPSRTWQEELNLIIERALQAAEAEAHARLSATEAFLADKAADSETLEPEWAPEPCDHRVGETCEYCELERDLDALIGP